jgi:hypothetical protein
MEGIYIIRSAADGRVLETERRRPVMSSAHIYLAPLSEDSIQYQLWTIFSREGNGSPYVFKNLATGAVFDVHFAGERVGLTVTCHGWHGLSNQNWSIYYSRAATSSYVH